MSEGYVKAEIRAGRLIARKLGRKTRILRSDFEAYAENQPRAGAQAGPDSARTAPFDEVDRMCPAVKIQSLAK